MFLSKFKIYYGKFSHNDVWTEVPWEIIPKLYKLSNKKIALIDDCSEKISTDSTVLNWKENQSKTYIYTVFIHPV